MILDVNENTLNRIQNPTLKEYASMYVDICRDFLAQVARTGIEIDQEDFSDQANSKIEILGKRGANLCNSNKSIRIGNISPACIACQTGMGSATFFISLKCHRNCYYCFNPNQENYEYYQENTWDVIEELKQIKTNKLNINHLALTGGEPLLHKDQTIAFFNYAQAEFPEIDTRLYTSGDHIDAEILKSLRDAGLQEIRFSIRLHDFAKGRLNTFKRIALAKEFIPRVMVEMPALPGTREFMQEILLELDRIGLFSINLLEFCYPFTNPEEYQKRGFKIKKRPFRVFYDYWYAGGMPVSGSELVCLDLLQFALDSNLSMGVHYCSVENKHTGQMYQQNSTDFLPPMACFSERDYLLKTAKVFGEDVALVKEVLDQKGIKDYQINPEHHSLEFHISKIPLLRSLNIEIGISSGVIESRKEGNVIRELKVDVATPQTFDQSTDI